MTQVHTSKGLIDRDLLTVKDIISDEPNARVIATEWHLGDELVRRVVSQFEFRVTGRSPTTVSDPFFTESA